jgi:uncharacterized Zn-binding protein involved in type VI secretion
MPAIARKDVDKASPHNGVPPSHLLFAEGSPNVFIGGNAVVRIGDKTAGEDVALTGSGTVFVNGIAAHRIGDSITAHPGGNPPILTCETGAPAGTVSAD